MRKKTVILIAIFLAGMCSIIYELLISTTATYFLGNGVRQFSLIIGIYLFSMGIGSYISKFLKSKPLLFFIQLEYLLGMIGGFSVPLLYFSFVTLSSLLFQLFCLVIVFIIGLLTGLEVPLLTFALNDIKDNISEVLSLDYLGGLIATLIFPFIILPFIGLFYSSLLFGIINISLGIALNIIYSKTYKKGLIIGGSMIILLTSIIIYAGQLMEVWDQKIYKRPVVYQEQTPYQKIVFTKKNNDIRLYLNRVVQFVSSDEHRYHESLVHIPFLVHGNPKSVLILGGGENLASREVLKHTNIHKIDVVDIDQRMFDLAKSNELLTNINKNAAVNKKVNLICKDAFSFLSNNSYEYDIIIADLPDPTYESIARLYSKQFYFLVHRSLDKDGVFVTQSGEIYFSNTAFNCIYNTLESCFHSIKAYHTYIPSFGDWGFIMAKKKEFPKLNFQLIDHIPQLKYLDAELAKFSMKFPNDITFKETKINTLDRPIILNYFLDDWSKWRADFENTTK